jgi:hypothetical protein
MRKECRELADHRKFAKIIPDEQRYRYTGAVSNRSAVKNNRTKSKGWHPHYG